MKLARAIRSLFETKKSATAFTLMQGGGVAVWSGRNYVAFAREGYQQNVVVYQCVNKIAEAVASVTWAAWKAGKLVTEHPALDLLANPSPGVSGYDFISEHVSHLMIAGNAYVEYLKPGLLPREMFQLRPDRMKIIPGAAGAPPSFQFTVGSQKTIFPVDDDGKSAIHHSRLFHPQDDFYGLSPMEAASYAIDQHTEAMKWIQALLQNSARPSGALVAGKDSGPLGDDAFARLKAQIEDQYSGSENAGRPMLLEGGLDWKQMGLSPSDMAVVETKNSAARDISLAFGVPPQLLGIPGDNTYSNYQEARLAFWEDTVIPLVKFLASGFIADLAARFGDIELRPEFAVIPAIVDKQAKRWEMANAATDLTVDERRAIRGFEPLPDGIGNVVLVPGTMIPLSGAEPKADSGLDAAFTAAAPVSIEFPEVMTINEKRASDGLEEIDGGDAIYIESSKIPAIEKE